MSMSWTTEQQQVIDLRDRNLLVSAAAGSGKTAVLVERILSRVTDPEHPIDIDRLLVVTFTRAAAGEMKARIGRALAEKLEEDPGNAHLRRQNILVEHAQISTIHGFCGSVLKDYFHRIDLDPSYRIAEEAELKVLANKVLSELFEEEYENNKSDSTFYTFLKAYGNLRGDKNIREMILRIYENAISSPDPDQWLEDSLAAYAPESETELENMPWMQRLLKESHDAVTDLARESEELIRYVEDHAEAPQHYLDGLRSDHRQLSRVCKTENYSDYRAQIQAVTFESLSRKKSDDESADLRKLVKDRRDAIKKEKERLDKKIFGMPVEDILAELKTVRPYATELIRLVRAFKERFAEEKRAQNVIDYSDMEHLTLAILTEKDENGERVPTEAARELAARFEEVMIDEYQDSNYLQDAILQSVSGKNGSAQNRFMVGDVKQSIYGFRKARPDLFLKYYDAWAEDDGAGVRIDLHKNFRSRKEVLDAANAVFSQIMIPELGGIAYDEKAALYPEAPYPELPEGNSAETELLLLNRKEDAFTGSNGRVTRIEAEAYVIAGRIRELRQNGILWDADKKTYRPVRPRDCVILLRGIKDWGDIFVRVLQEEGIPAYAVGGAGFFDTIEVQTVVNFLKVCDNPRNDIPLAAVLRSPIVGLTDAELAEMRRGAAKETLYETLRRCASEQGESEAGRKCAAFTTLLDAFRARLARTPVHELLRAMFAATRYDEIAAAMPGGAQRKANLDLLLEIAARFATSKEKGLFPFLQYLKELEENEVDLGQANLHSEEEDIVRVMTIHKSKGLEFPVVFLAGIGRNFNRSDENNSVVMHEKFGIGMAAIYLAERRKQLHTLLRDATTNAIRQDSMAEELRVLYVAMTRAKEKLILVGSGEPSPKETLPLQPSYQQILNARSYLDWIRMASTGAWPIKETEITLEEIAFREIHDSARLQYAAEEAAKILKEGRPGDYAPAFAKALEAIRLASTLPEEERMLPAKLTVTELKRITAELSVEETGAMLYPSERENTVSVETEAHGALTGAARGTAYHHVFATLDLGRYPIEEAVSETVLGEELDRMQKDGILTEEERNVVRENDICTFLESELGCRMRKAAAAGTLRREQPFVLDLPATEVLSLMQSNAVVADAEQTILIQGTIDAYWEEDGKYILMDYKTDRIGAGEEEQLAERYRVQLDLYARALTGITEIPVRERWIYSVTQGKEIPV